MPNEAITRAIKSVLGEYASPKKIAALDAVLRPIYGREAAVFVEEKVREYTDEFGDFSRDVAHAVSALREAADELWTYFGVTDNG